MICFELHRNGTENESSNINDPSTERFQLQMLVLHQSMCISKATVLSLRQVRAKCKDEVLDLLDLNW